jgi:RNA polymerase sigma factor (sigma-70 family)
MSEPSEIVGVSEMQSASVSELMLYVDEHRTDRRAAEAAFVEIIRRYRGYFYKVCENIVNGRVSRTSWLSVDDLLNIVLSKIWEHAGQFDEPADLSPKDQERCFLAWCGQIANHAAIDELSKSNQEELKDDLFWQSWQPVALEPSMPSDSKHVDALQEAFEELDERSKEVLLATAFYMRPNAGHHRIPPEENRELAARLGVTTASLRKIRERAYAKIRQSFISKGITI